MTEHIDDQFLDEIPHEPEKKIDGMWLPSCPIGLPQLARPCLGYYEREPLRLQLRVAMLDNEGVCDVVLDEQDSCVVVRVVICWRDDLPHRHQEAGFAEDRTHADLREPLNGRPLIDFETDEPIPFYVPTWRHGHRTKAPGYYTEREQAIAAAELLPRSEDDRPLFVKGGLARSRTLGF